ncbi:MAG: cbb3-type cytochrome c oxidase subunit I, partial [Planctomycetes bacterium]|nr:cbb3-type cytochrome c oxidase subunit I [Planctomycetota bacterium]
MKVEITKNTIIKDLVEKYPSTVEVFRKHKLLIAGGVRGPNEPLGFFAKAHDVNYDELVKELHEAIEKGTEGAVAPVLVVDRLYEKYVKAAIILILTAGATFGAAILTGIGIKGDFRSIPYSIIQPHGFAQLFGWLGLCIMGFGYYIIPRVKGTELYGKKLPEFVFWLMIGGIALRTVIQPIPDDRLNILLPISGVALVVAVCLFAYGIFNTMRQSTNPLEVFDKFFVAGVVWFIINSLINLAMTIYLFISPTKEIPQSIFAPFVHLFLFGFAIMFIFAINLRTVYAFLDLEKPITWLANSAFIILNIAVPIYFITTWLKYNHVVFLKLSQLSIYFIVLAGFMFIYAIRIFSRRTKELEDIVMDRSYEKAIKAAYAWLIIALIMFIFETFLKQPEQAYLFHGSANHAITVGFITMMIIGYSSKMIPTFTGINLFSTRLSDITFIMLNTGIFIRVSSQIMTGFYGGPFYI